MSKKKLLKRIQNVWAIIPKKMNTFFDWLNSDSNVKQKSLKLKSIKNLISGAALITFFCYAFTTTYFEAFGISYFIHFEYTDIYGFTLGRLDVFSNSILLISLVATMFAGFFIEFKATKKKYFSKGQVFGLSLMLFVPIVYLTMFVLYYSNSLKDVLLTIGILLIAIFFVNQHGKARHDIFLIFFIIITSINGMILGKVFAKERFNNEKYIDLINSDNTPALRKTQLVLGQNKTTFITIDKNDSIIEFIPKSKIAKVNFKGRLKSKKKVQGNNIP